MVATIDWITNSTIEKAFILARKRRLMITGILRQSFRRIFGGSEKPCYRTPGKVNERIEMFQQQPS
jgi:hypothetical protein